jgi:hypothetical protein
MVKLTVNERRLLAEKLKGSRGFLIHFIKIVMIRPEISASSVQNGIDLIQYLDNVPDVLPQGFFFDVIIKIYNYGKDSGLDTEPGIFWIAWQAELNENTLAYCNHTHTILENGERQNIAKYEYKYQVSDDGERVEEEIPMNLENYKVPFLHNAANPQEFRPKGSWLSANISFNKGGEHSVKREKTGRNAF